MHSCEEITEKLWRKYFKDLPRPEGQLHAVIYRNNADGSESPFDGLITWGTFKDLRDYFETYVKNK